MKINKSIYNNKASFLLLASTILIAIFGLLSPFSYNVLPSTEIFEVLFFIFAALSIKNQDKKALRYMLFATAYVMSCFIIMRLTQPSDTLDFIQAYKSFLYIIPLSFIIRKHHFNPYQIKFMFYALLLMFSMKYIYSRIFNFDDALAKRPGIFTENNYELILLIILFYLASPSLEKLRTITFVFLAFLVIISGSRSALLALLVVYTSVYIKRINYKIIISASVLVGLGIIFAYIFSERLAGGSVEDIDRYRFFMVFLDETKNWSIFNYLLGSLPITPLSMSSCTTLYYYQSLFSHSGDGSCYSVILHSYLLRVIFDQGLLGLLFVLAFIFYGLTKAGYSTRQKLCLVGVLIASGLSVSSLNSVYSAISLAIAFSFPQSSQRRSYY